MFLDSDCWRIGINHFFPPPTIRMAIEPGVWGLAGFTLVRCGVWVEIFIIGLQVQGPMKLWVGYEFYISPVGTHCGPKNHVISLNIRQGAKYFCKPNLTMQCFFLFVK
jgi:hypothetical protein